MDLLSSFSGPFSKWLRNGTLTVESWWNVRGPISGEKSEKKRVRFFMLKWRSFWSQNGYKMELFWMSFLIKNSFFLSEGNSWFSFLFLG